MNRSDIIKDLNRILNKYNINLPDMESLLDDLYEVVNDARYEGYCDGKDAAFRD